MDPSLCGSLLSSRPICSRPPRAISGFKVCPPALRHLREGRIFQLVIVESPRAASNVTNGADDVDNKRKREKEGKKYERTMRSGREDDEHVWEIPDEDVGLGVARCTLLSEKDIE